MPVQSISAREAARRLENRSAICTTTKARKKKVCVLKIDKHGPLHFNRWKDEQFVFPQRLVVASSCFGKTWIFVITPCANGGLLYSCVERATRLEGRSTRSPTTALKEAYKQVFPGKKFPASHDGRAEVGAFEDAVQAIICATCQASPVDYPELIVRADANVLLHGNVDQTLMDDPLVTLNQVDAKHEHRSDDNDNEESDNDAGNAPNHDLDEVEHGDSCQQAAVKHDNDDNSVKVALAVSELGNELGLPLLSELANYIEENVQYGLLVQHTQHSADAFLEREPGFPDSWPSDMDLGFLSNFPYEAPLESDELGFDIVEPAVKRMRQEILD